MWSGIACMAWLGRSDLQLRYFRKYRKPKPKMKRGVELEKILPRAEQGVQNGGFLQRR